MAWVYPNTLLGVQEWYPYPANMTILDTLTLGDDEFAYTNAGIFANYLSVGMPTVCSLLHLRARRGTGLMNTASLIVQVYNTQTGDSTQYTINLTSVPNWTDYYFTPSHTWDAVYLEGDSLDVDVGVSVLRGEAGGAPTRRTLTGVGV